MPTSKYSTQWRISTPDDRRRIENTVVAAEFNQRTIKTIIAILLQTK
jgi:hypothetical protein